MLGVGIMRIYLYRIRDPKAVGNLPQASGVDIFVLNPDQLPRLREVRASLDLQELEKNLQKGSVCYGASHSGRLAHYSLVQTSGQHRIRRAGRSEDVVPGQFWIYESWTSNAARGLGIYPSVLVRILSDHFERGLREGVIYTSEHNVASQRGILKAGFHHEQTLRAIRIGRYYGAI